MPAVPTYNTPQATEAALPAARVDSVASPGILDAGADQQAALGAGIQHAGSGLMGIAYHMAQRENADAVFQAETSDKAAFINYQSDVQQNRQGQYAKGVTTDTANWWKDRIAQNVEGLSNDAQKQLYSQRATSLQLQTLSSMSSFEGQQTEIAHDQSWKADKANTINLAAANPTDDSVASSTAQIKQFNSYQAARKGWNPDVLQAENTADITDLHKQVIQQLVSTNPDVAKAYYDAHKSEIAGSQQAEIGQFAERATAASTGAAVAQQVWSAAGPQNDTDASNIDQMKATIRDQLKDNTYARDAALQQISQMDSDRDKGIHARVSNETSQVNTMLMHGQSLAAVQQTPVWQTLDGNTQRSITDHEEQLAATRANRAASDASRAYSNAARNQIQLNTAGLDTTMRLSDPTVLTSMSRDDVVNLRTQLGNENTQSLLNKWDTLTKNSSALSEAKIDNDQFNVFATQAGLNPSTKAPDAMKQQVIDVRNSIEQILGQEQLAKKRMLTRDERNTIMQQQLDNKVMQHNWFSSDVPTPAIALPKDDQGSAYVNVNGQKITLSNIPNADRSAIIAARQRAGLPVTEQSIAEMYVRKNNMKPNGNP